MGAIVSAATSLLVAALVVPIDPWYVGDRTEDSIIIYGVYFFIVLIIGIAEIYLVNMAIVIGDKLVLSDLILLAEMQEKGAGILHRAADSETSDQEGVHRKKLHDWNRETFEIFTSVSPVRASIWNGSHVFETRGIEKFDAVGHSGQYKRKLYLYGHLLDDLTQDLKEILANLDTGN